MVYGILRKTFLSFTKKNKKKTRMSFHLKIWSEEDITVQSLCPYYYFTLQKSPPK